MGLSDSLRGMFGFLFTRSRAEGAVAEFVVREHHRGRSLTEILADPYVTNRCSREQIDRLLDRPEVVHAIGEDMISSARASR
ncbi:MAG TPA: hypothetical protein VGU02_05770 [Gaiellaceae bacterium]|nr:hypothetical protein [Gaiellaceae bacterium]